MYCNRTYMAGASCCTEVGLRFGRRIVAILCRRVQIIAQTFRIAGPWNVRWSGPHDAPPELQIAPPVPCVRPAAACRPGRLPGAAPRLTADPPGRDRVAAQRGHAAHGFQRL